MRKPVNRALLNADGDLASEVAVLDALKGLCASSHPMSSTGGWFSTSAVAIKSGLQETTARLRLQELEHRGIVEAHERRKAGLRWRIKNGLG